MNDTRHRFARTAAQRLALALAMTSALGAPAFANDVVIDEIIDCTIDTSCADVYEVRCPQRSRYLCANVENTATHGASESHFFQVAAFGTAPAVFVGVGGMTTVPPEQDDSVCLTKPETSRETPLKGVVMVTRTFGGSTMLNGPDTYRLTAFCVSDEDGANQTIATLKQDQ